MDTLSKPSMKRVAIPIGMIRQVFIYTGHAMQAAVILQCQGA